MKQNWKLTKPIFYRLLFIVGLCVVIGLLIQSMGRPFWVGFLGPLMSFIVQMYFAKPGSLFYMKIDD